MDRRIETTKFLRIEFSENRKPTNDVVYLQTEVLEFMVGKEQRLAAEGALLIEPIVDKEYEGDEEFPSYPLPYYEANPDIWMFWFSYFYLNENDSEDIPEALANYYQGVV